MSHIVKQLLVCVFALFLQGCNKTMDYKPQDFFEGEQLAIARLIYEGSEPVFKEKIATVSQDTLNRPAKAGITLLFWSLLNATYNNITPERLKIITDLVKAGADPLQPKGFAGISPAEFAVRGDKGVWIKALLEGGLSANARDKINGEPIIFQSRYAKNTETLKVMLDYGADKDIRDTLHQTLLVGAFISLSLDHVELLLSRGANPNPIDINGISLLSRIQRDIKTSKEGTEYNERCKKILNMMIAKGAKE